MSTGITLEEHKTGVVCTGIPYSKSFLKLHRNTFLSRYFTHLCTDRHHKHLCSLATIAHVYNKEHITQYRTS